MGGGGYISLSTDMQGPLGYTYDVPHYPETRASPGGYLHRAGSLGIRSGRHAHAPGINSCNGNTRHTSTYIHISIRTHPPEDRTKKRKNPTYLSSFNNIGLFFGSLRIYIYVVRATGARVPYTVRYTPSRKRSPRQPTLRNGFPRDAEMDAP